MKTGGHYACRSEFLGMRSGLRPENQPALGTTSFKMHHGTLAAYAASFSRYLDAYAAEGVNISAIHGQNEPVAAQVFPSCTWRAQDFAHFIGHYVGPAFAREQRKTEIWFGTINSGDLGYLLGVLGDPVAAPFIQGMGLQWAGKDAIAALHQKLPTLPIMQTETECGDGSNDWAAALHTWSLIKQYLTNGAGRAWPGTWCSTKPG